jgi:RNA polymerase primary sigma factor
LLSPKEAKIITLRYGLLDNYPRTLNEVGDMFKLSRERIRQIENKALMKLRNPQNITNLSAFFTQE